MEKIVGSETNKIGAEASSLEGAKSAVSISSASQAKVDSGQSTEAQEKLVEVAKRLDIQLTPDMLS